VAGSLPKTCGDSNSGREFRYLTFNGVNKGFWLFLLNWAIHITDTTLESYNSVLSKIGRQKMGIDHSSQGILTVDLLPEPDMATELDNVAKIVREEADCNVVVDFSSVDIITSSSISKLLKLKQLLDGYGHQLILCGLINATKQILKLAGLDQVFDFADDKSAALTAVKHAQQVKS
jgi:anti-anti-sigma factor